MMTRLPFLVFGFAVALAAGARAAETPPSGAAERWVNASDAPMPVTAKAPPKQPVFLQTAPNGRPFRILPAAAQGDALRLVLPPKATVELWDRPALAREVTLFGNAARWGALPRIALGPTFPAPGGEGEITPWSDAAGHFRAYPNADITVTVRVRNDGLGVWTHPRVELFAPDNWIVTPTVAEVLSPQRKGASAEAPSISAGQSGVLPPTVTGTATFTVRMPDSARDGLPYPLIAFLRFNTVGETLTVQNSVDVTVEPPVSLRFGMNEAGTKFVTRIENRFRPAALGQAEVEVAAPEGSGWKVRPPAPVEVAGGANAASEVQPAPPGDAGLRLAVTVRVAGSVVRRSPLIYAVARYAGEAAHEDGVHAAPDATARTTDGLPFPGGAERALGFDVDPAFALSDPAAFVSPTWVTVTLQNRGATRARLEYDAFGNTAPVVAGDVPIANTNGAVTLSFLLPDARFAGGLPGGADLRIVLNDDASLTRLTVSKWNPRD